jgi:hypothetical protein
MPSANKHYPLGNLLISYINTSKKSGDDMEAYAWPSRLIASHIISRICHIIYCYDAAIRRRKAVEIMLHSN